MSELVFVDESSRRPNIYDVHNEARNVFRDSCITINYKNQVNTRILITVYLFQFTCKSIGLKGAQCNVISGLELCSYQIYT